MIFAGSLVQYLANSDDLKKTSVHGGKPIQFSIRTDDSRTHWAMGQLVQVRDVQGG